MTASTESLPDLDEATKQQLQPPCALNMPRTGRRCDRPARWIVKVRCPKCRRVATSTACDMHFEGFVGGRNSVCSIDGDVTAELISAERL